MNLFRSISIYNCLIFLYELFSFINKFGCIKCLLIFIYHSWLIIENKCFKCILATSQRDEIIIYSWDCLNYKICLENIHYFVMSIRFVCVFLLRSSVSMSVCLSLSLSLSRLHIYRRTSYIYTKVRIHIQTHTQTHTQTIAYTN